jgi:molybdopterin converting factor small subunit
MAQYVYPSEEYFVLQNPAVLRDLLSDVVTKHPSLAPMIATMEILRDGAPVKPDSALRDGDEIDFIPTIAGG